MLRQHPQLDIEHKTLVVSKTVKYPTHMNCSRISMFSGRSDSRQIFIVDSFMPTILFVINLQLFSLRTTFMCTVFFAWLSN